MQGTAGQVAGAEQSQRKCAQQCWAYVAPLTIYDAVQSLWLRPPTGEHAMHQQGHQACRLARLLAAGTFTGRLHAHVSAQSVIIKGARAFVEGAGIAGQPASSLLPAGCPHTSLP